MSRPLILGFLLMAVLGTGLLTVHLLRGEGGAGRLGPGREAPDAPEGNGSRAPAPPMNNVRREEATSQRGWEISGKVRDREGRPVPGAAVRVTGESWSREARAGEDGGYALEPPEPAFAFDVYATGYLPLTGTANGGSNGTLDYVFDGEGPWTQDFTLERAAALTGRVLAPTGAPVPGATVYAISAEHQVLDTETVANVVRTDADGRYVFPGLGPGPTDIGVKARGFLPRMELDVEVPEQGTVERDFVLERGRRIDVTVEPADVPATVTAADSRLRALLLPPGGLDLLRHALVGRAFVGLPVVEQGERTEGVYVLEGVGPGPADVWAQAQAPVRYAPESARFVGDVPLGLESLNRGRWIAEDGLGRLLDTVAPKLTLRLLGAVPVLVTVRDANTGQVLRPAVTRVSDGVEFPMPDMLVPKDGRRHALRFALDGYEPAELPLPAVESMQHFDVVMYPTIEGDKGTFRVVLEPPLPDGRLALVGRDAAGRVAWVRHLDRPDAEGRWPVPPVPAGEYVVTVLATGMVPAVIPRVVVAPGIQDTFTVAVTKGGGLSMRVTDAEGTLLDQVHILLRDGAGNPIDVHVMTRVSDGRAFVSVNYLPSAATATADSGLAPGSYTLAAGREGFAPASKSFSIAGTEVAEVTIVLGPQ